MPTTTIDVSGLSEAVVSDLQRLVSTLRTAAPPITPPPAETAEEWIARFRAWVESHAVRNVTIDDSRESIYEGRGE